MMDNPANEHSLFPNFNNQRHAKMAAQDDGSLYLGANVADCVSMPGHRDEMVTHPTQGGRQIAGDQTRMRQHRSSSPMNSEKKNTNVSANPW